MQNAMNAGQRPVQYLCEHQTADFSFCRLHREPGAATAASLEILQQELKHISFLNGRGPAVEDTFAKCLIIIPDCAA